VVVVLLWLCVGEWVAEGRGVAMASIRRCTVQDLLSMQV
jgi:hypothetical protein